MKPSRPESAKSAKTRITIDSDTSSNNIVQSRLAETFSSGGKFNAQKNEDFEKYVAEKNKDPKFKKFLEPTMPQIPEQTRPKVQLSKLNSKPFDKKSSKVDKQKQEKKVQEPPSKKIEESKTNKKQNLQSSKTFMDKSRLKLKVPSKQQIQPSQGTPRIQKISENENKTNEQSKPKINLNGFVLNVPGKPPQVIKQIKQEKPKQTQETRLKKERQRVLTELSEYVQGIEDRNIQYLPKRYEQFVERNLGNRHLQIESLNIEDFLNEPNERDYQKLAKRINQNEKALENGSRNFQLSQLKKIQSRSIDLDEIIDGSQGNNEDSDDISVIMSSMSASDVRERNMFLTEILKGKRLTEDEVSQIRDNDQVMVKLIKMQGLQKQEEHDEDNTDGNQINMKKKKSNKFMERNKIEAVGQMFRECDYLTEEQRKRINDIIEGAKIESPFQLNEMQRLMVRGIDEGIKFHRKLCQKTEEYEKQMTVDEETLPKDPLLRKKAELKILRERVNSVNQRLGSINEIVVTKTKIQNLINNCKQSTRPSQMSQSIIQQKRRQMQEQSQQLKIAQKLLFKIENQKEQMLDLADEMIKRFGKMQEEVNRLQNMDIEERRKMEQDELKLKKLRLDQVERQAQQFEQQVEGIIAMGEEIKRKLSVLDQIMDINTTTKKCEGYTENQTIEQLDELVTRKWEAAEQAVRTIREESQ